MKVLVIASHPDDEVLGCGGTIAKHVEKGDIVSVVMVTMASDYMWDADFRQQKFKEQMEVDKLLGIKFRHQLHYDSLDLTTIRPAEISFRLFGIIQATKPDIVYTHYEHDLHTDHQVVSHCTTVACRSEHYKGKLLQYEIPCETDKPYTPNYYVELNDEHFEKKLDAFEIYKSEVKHSPHPRSFIGIKNLSLYRADQICSNHWVEAFRLIREVKKWNE